MTRRRLTTTMTRTGRITIPAWIARRLRLQPGDRLDISPHGTDTFIATLHRRPEVSPRGSSSS